MFYLTFTEHGAKQNKKTWGNKHTPTLSNGPNQQNGPKTPPKTKIFTSLTNVPGFCLIRGHDGQHGGYPWPSTSNPMLHHGVLPPVTHEVPPPTETPPPPPPLTVRFWYNTVAPEKKFQWKCNNSVFTAINHTFLYQHVPKDESINHGGKPH